MLKLEDLVCPHCDERNRPGVGLIVREPTGLIVCNACGFGWREPPPQKPQKE